MKDAIYTGDEFIKRFEDTHSSIVDSICNQFIDSISACNPTRNDMSRADWLKVMMYRYKVVVRNEHIFFEPLN